jgi:hypothetical protein
MVGSGPAEFLGFHQSPRTYSAQHSQGQHHGTKTNLPAFVAMNRACQALILRRFFWLDVD